MKLQETLRIVGRVRTARRGLTLLELVVVMAILVALGGLLVPMLGNYLHRANVASCTVNIPEVDKWFQTYQNLYTSYPDKMDNLVVDTALASYVLPGKWKDVATDPSIELGSLDTASEASALTEMGITTLMKLAPSTTGGDWNPTFWPYSANKGAALTSANYWEVKNSLAVAELTATGARLMGLPYVATKHKYVVFGLNTPCTMFRNVAAEAPYHFADTLAEDPSKSYMCFAAVFMINNKDGDTLEKAKYMGCAAFHDFGLATAAAHTEEWWSRLNEEKPN